MRQSKGKSRNGEMAGKKRKNMVERTSGKGQKVDEVI